MYVESQVEFNVPKSKILDLIREPGNLNKYHPFCKKNDAINWPGNGSIDHLEYHNGMKLNREFYNWTDDGYDLKIGGKRNMAIVNWIVKGDDNKSSLRVRINPNIKNYIKIKNRFVQRALWFIYIKPMLQSYINHVLMGFNHFIKTETVVLQNQFGTHKWFS
tara:strand:- start:1705 stop:2190 length:486 start_codon:yes stop_codon:yes gene_type:complete